MSGVLAARRAFDATDRLPTLSGIHSLVLSAVHDPIAPPASNGQAVSRIERALASGALPNARLTNSPRVWRRQAAQADRLPGLGRRAPE